MNNTNVVYSKGLGELKLKKDILLGIYICLPFLSLINGTGYSEIISVAMLFISLFYFYSEKFYILLIPIFFFYKFLVLPFGISYFRVMSIIYILTFILTNKKKNIVINKKYSGVILIFVLYCVLSYTQISFSQAGTIILDILFAYLFAAELANNEQNLRRFSIVLAVSGLVAGLFGIYNQMSVKHIYDYVVSYDSSAINRYLATFIDPNYASFFYNLIIVLLLSTKWGKYKKLKLPLVITSYIFLLMAGSITGLIGNIFILMCYFMLADKKVNMKTMMITVGILFVLFSFIGGDYYKQIPMLDSLSARIEYTYEQYVSGNINSGSDGRFDLFNNSIKYYLSQPTVNKLFGGNIMTTSSIDRDLMNILGGGTHNAYIDLLLCFGLLGTITILLILMRMLYENIKKYMAQKSEVNISKILIFVLITYYGMALNIFPDWKFIAFVFIL